jgi:hypothetical protein
MTVAAGARFATCGVAAEKSAATERRHQVRSGIQISIVPVPLFGSKSSP